MNALLKNVLVRPLSVLLFALLFLVALMAFLVLSGAGTRLLANNIQQFIPNLTLDEIEGVLVEGINAKHLQWYNDTLSIDATQVKSTHAFEMGFTPNLDVKTLTIDTLTVRMKKDESNSTESDSDSSDDSNRMPLNLFAKSADVNVLDIWLEEAKQPLHFEGVHFQGDFPSGEFSLQHLNATVKSAQLYWGDAPITLKNLIIKDGKIQNDVLFFNPFEGQLTDSNGTVNVKATGQFGLTQPNALAIDLLANSKHRVWGNGTLHAKIGGELHNYTLQSDANWQYATYPRYEISALGRGTFESFNAEKLTLKGEAGNAVVTGSVNWAQGIKWDKVHVVGQNLNPSIVLPDMPAKLTLDGYSSGQWYDKNPLIKFDIRQLKGVLRDYPVDAKGKGQWNGKLLAAEHLDVLVGKNRLIAQGQATDTLKVAWQLDAPELNQLHPKLTGNVKGNGQLQGKIDGSTLQVDIASLNGRLQEYDVTAKGALIWNNQMLSAQNLNLTSGNNRLNVSGQVMELFNVQFDVDAKNLSTAWNGLSGSLKGQGTFKGTLQKPEVQADLKGSGLQYQGYRLGSVDAKLNNMGGQYNVDAIATQASLAGTQVGALKVKLIQTGAKYQLDATLNTLKSGSTQVQSVAVQGEGSLENHRLNATIKHVNGNATFSATGGWRNDEWQGNVSNLELDKTPAGDWRATQTITLSASKQAFSSSSICLVNNQGAQFCAKPAWKPTTGVALTGSLQRVPLAMFRTWLPANISASGVANAEYVFEQRAGRPWAKATIRLPDSAISIRDAKGKVETLQYTNVQADLDLDDKLLSIKSQLELKTYGNIRAAGQVTLAPNSGQHHLNLHITSSMPDIGWLARFSPQVDQLKGQLNSDFTLTGLSSKPNISGSLQITNASLLLPETGARLTDMRLTVQATGSDTANVNGSFRTGDNGVLTARGTATLGALSQWRADVVLQGSNLKLMDTYEAQVWVSPNLNIQATPKNVAVTGSVTIPEALIALQELPPTAKRLSDDVVIVGRRAPVRPAQHIQTVDESIGITPNVSVIVGDKVKFSGFGVDARLNGKLQILQTRQDIVAQGTLNILDGKYKAYGQNLSIERGRLLFNGPIDNPGLDVRAIREVEEDAKVGMELAGTLQKPESTLFSTPSMSQTDILSYLLTGRPLSSLSGNESNLVLQAVTGLGIAGGDSLVQQIGNQLGLDSVNLSAKNGDYQQSELALGKRLGPKLYVKYIVGLFDSIQRLVFTYQVNKHLQLEGQTGLYQSIDLIYKIDTDTGPFGK